MRPGVQLAGLLFALNAAILFPATNSFAACVSPAGNEGDVSYSATQHVMAYCNGSNWISMGTSSTTSYGTLTAGDFCTATSSSGIACTTAQVNLASQVTGNLAVGNLPSLASANFWLGNGSSAATAVAMSGDCTIANTGAITCTKTNGSSFGTLATLSAAPAGTLTGTTLASNVVSSSLTGVGTITSGIWNGTGIGIGYGGTNATSQTTNGVNYYNGTSITSGNGFVYTGGQVGIGTATPTAALTLLGTEAIQFGANYSTTGTQNDVAISGNGSVRYTGAGVATFRGIVAGASGQITYLHNGSSSALTLSNQNASDTTVANQIVTGTGSDLTVASNSAVALQYDQTATNSGGATGAWRVIGGSGGGGAVPAGTTGQVQYNSGSNTLAANQNFTFLTANNQLVVGTGAATPAAIGATGEVASFVVNVIPQASTNTGSSIAGGITLNTGVTGQMAYYSGASAISGTSNLNVSGSNIGIGTATASQPLTVNGNADLMGSNAVLTEIANASSTGTTANKLAKLTGAPSTALITATTDTGGALGIVVGNAGTSGNAQIAIAGQASCVFENTTVAGDYVQIGSSTAGDCHDAGSTYPTSGQVLGRVLASGSAGTYAVALFGPEISPASGGNNIACIKYIQGTYSASVSANLTIGYTMIGAGGGGGGGNGTGGKASGGGGGGGSSVIFANGSNVALANGGGGGLGTGTSDTAGSNGTAGSTASGSFTISSGQTLTVYVGGGGGGGGGGTNGNGNGGGGGSGYFGGGGGSITGAGGGGTTSGGAAGGTGTAGSSLAGGAGSGSGGGSGSSPGAPGSNGGGGGGYGMNGGLGGTAISTGGGGGVGFGGGGGAPGASGTGASGGGGGQVILTYSAASCSL
jgi:hypothetical protein